mgnify:CR=1 FL=1
MFSYKVMIVSFILLVIDAIILLNYHNEEVHGLEERILILMDKAFAITFGIFLVSAAATICQIFGWV